MTGLTSFIRTTRAVRYLKRAANAPLIGKAIRWAARQLRDFEQKSTKLRPENREHDTRQNALLEQYRNGE